MFRIYLYVREYKSLSRFLVILLSLLRERLSYSSKSLVEYVRRIAAATILSSFLMSILFLRAACVFLWCTYVRARTLTCSQKHTRTRAHVCVSDRFASTAATSTKTTN